MSRQVPKSTSQVNKSGSQQVEKYRRRLFDWSTELLVDSLTGRLSDWLTHILSNWVTFRLIHQQLIHQSTSQVVLLHHEQDVTDINTDATLQLWIVRNVRSHGFPVAVEGQSY